MPKLQSVPVPLLSSLMNLHNHGSNFLLHSHAQTPSSGTLSHAPSKKEALNVISTELECIIHKSSSSGSIGNGDDDVDDLELSSGDSGNEFPLRIRTEIELSTMGDAECTEHGHSRSRGCDGGGGRCNVMPWWMLYVWSLDEVFSSKIHRLSCGSMDYVFVFGAFVFGSKFMPITILLSIFMVDVPGFIYLLLCCTITVSL